MLEIFILFFILVCINLLQLKFSTPGSDHFVHFGYINSIRANKNRFITKEYNSIYEDDFLYPQLYHWILSFFSSNFLYKNYKYLGLILNVFSLFFFILFLHLIFPYLSLSVAESRYILWAGLIYIFTPFEYFTWNAKNVGLSARGFGLMFGYLFVFSITLYFFSTNYWYFICSIFFSYIILLSSQFGFQFVIFFCIATPFLGASPFVALIPVISAIIFLLTFPRWSIIFFSRQWKFKKCYYKAFSDKIIFRTRYSIWRDFVYDFWKVFKKKSFIKGAEYIYRNPVCELLLGFPVIAILTLHYFFYRSTAIFLNHEWLLIVIFSGFIVFLITSFRQTRFLGEPQRYVEFVFPLMSILPVFINDTLLYITIISVSVLIIVFEIIGVKLLAKKHQGGISFNEKAMQLVSAFDHIPISHNNNKLLCNTFEVLRYFSDKDFKLMNVMNTSEFIAGLHFDEIFPETYGDFSLKSVLHFIKFYKINWFILDQKKITKEMFEKNADIPFEEIGSVYHYLIYKIC